MDCNCHGACACRPAAKTGVKGTNMTATTASQTFKDQLLTALLRATPEEDIRSAFIDASMLKAMEVGGAGQERPSAEMSDRVVDQSIAPMRGKAPGKEELKFGPTQAASGGDAERMISQYSEPAPQQDIVVQYERLSNMLGSLGKAMEGIQKALEAQATAFTTLVKKAEDEEEEDEQEINIGAEEAEDEEETGKSLTPAMRAYFRATKAELLAKADEEDEEGEQEINIAVEENEEEEEAEKALRPDSLLGMAKALFLAAKAASVETKVSKAARPRLRKLTEGAVRRAWGMAKKAGAAKEAAKLASEIAEYAYLKGFSLKAKAPTKAASDATKDISEDESDHQQRKWATSGKAATDAVADAVTKEDVLKGLAILNGNVATLWEAMAGGKGVNLPATPLGLISKAAPVADGTAPVEGAPLFKAALAAEPLFKSWQAAKTRQIEACVDSGEFDLVDELAAGTIMATAFAVHSGAASEAALKARVMTANEKIRSLFQDVVAS